MGVGAAVNVVTNTTTARIGDSAQINQDVTGNAHGSQDVLVGAGSDFNHVGVGIGVAGSGSVAGAPGVDVSVVSLTTLAEIDDDAVVDAESDVVVRADATESFLLVGAGGAGGGLVAIGGGIAVVKVTNITTARVGLRVDIEAGGNVAVVADDDTSMDVITGGVGIGVGEPASALRWPSSFSTRRPVPPSPPTLRSMPKDSASTRLPAP